MSRIFEALQKADLERKSSAHGESSSWDSDSAAIPGIEEFVQPQSSVDLNLIAHYSWKMSTPSFPTLVDRGVEVEQFRGLRSRIYQARYESPLKTILVTSGMPGEGKSFIAANLAVSLARNGVNNILLIDGDLRRPTLHSLLGAPQVPGLAEYLTGDVEAQDILQRDRHAKTAQAHGVAGVSNLAFIPAGACGDNSSELVVRDRMAELIATLSPHFEWIVIDSPPVMAVTDAVELSHVADAVLLVAREARTPYAVAQRTQAALVNSRILGFVLNAAKDPAAHGASYSNYYGSKQEANPTAEKEPVGRKP